MMKQEVQCFLSPWRAIAEPNFWRSMLRDPVTGLCIVLWVIQASVNWIIYCLITTEKTRTRRDQLEE